MRCTLGPHDIKGAPKYFTDERHINFVKKSRREFRPSQVVCADCYKNIIRVYEIKLASAIKKFKERRLKSAKQCVSDPSISSTTATSSRTCNDSFDKMVFRTPRNPNLKTVVSESRLETNGSETSSESSSSSGAAFNVATQSQGSITSSDRRLPSIHNQPSPLNTQPSTSAAAALRRQKSARRDEITESSSNVSQNVYDPWDDVASPAALDGTRLPHVQPILKSKKVVSVNVNKDVMQNFYLKNITGG